MTISTVEQTILVVDDDKDIVRLLRAYLEQAGYKTLTAYNGNDALHILRHDRPALVVLDLMLPDQDGWNITRIVRRDPELSQTPIIMLTARVDDTDKIVGLELGADDYITKPFNPREVVARIGSVLRRTLAETPYKQARILRLGGLMMDLDRHEVKVDGCYIDLTSTEFNILETLLKNPGYVFTRTELIEKSLGYEYEGLERTLDSHIRNLRRKVEPNPKQPVYIHTVYGVGYKLIGL